MTLTRLQLVLLALAVTLLGALAGFVPSLVLDLRFLHAARLYSEFAAQQQQQQSTVQRVSPGSVAPSTSTTPAPVPVPTETPPKK